MIIDLTPLFSGEVKELPLDYKEAVSGEAYERYFDGLGIDISGEVEITGRIYDMSAYMQLEITAKLPYRSQCCRCLKETEGAVICKIERVLSANEADGEEDDVIVYTDRKIDPEETVLFEDGLYSIRTAAALGIKTVGVYDRISRTDQEAIRDLAWDYLPEGASLAELTRILDNAESADNKNSK